MQHCARLLMSSRYEHSSLFIMWSMMMVSLHTVLLVSGSAVMSVQCEQEGAEHITLGSSGVGLVYYLDQQPHLYSHSYCLYQASTCFFVVQNPWHQEMGVLAWSDPVIKRQSRYQSCSLELVDLVRTFECAQRPGPSFFFSSSLLPATLPSKPLPTEKLLCTSRLETTVTDDTI